MYVEYHIGGCGSQQPSTMSNASTQSSQTADRDADYLVLYRVTPIDGSESPQLASEVIDNRDDLSSFDYDSDANGARTALNSDSGYMMRFAHADRYRQLSAHDILTIPHLTSYPVPQTALSSLPATIRAELENRGIIRIKTVYQNGRFYGTTLGWETPDGFNPATWFRSAIRHDVSPIAALDYFMVELAGQTPNTDGHTIETWADERGVTPDTIKRSIQDVESTLDATQTPS